MVTVDSLTRCCVCVCVCVCVRNKLCQTKRRRGLRPSLLRVRVSPGELTIDAIGYAASIASIQCNGQPIKSISRRLEVSRFGVLFQ